MFPTRIGLRLTEADQTDMVLGDGARQAGAVCDRIPESLPGVAYVVQEGIREPLRVRAAYVSDDELRVMQHDYAHGMPDPAPVVEPDGTLRPGRSWLGRAFGRPVVVEP